MLIPIIHSMKFYYLHLFIIIYYQFMIIYYYYLFTVKLPDTSTFDGSRLLLSVFQILCPEMRLMDFNTYQIVPKIHSQTWGVTDGAPFPLPCFPVSSVSSPCSPTPFYLFTREMKGFKPFKSKRHRF